MAVASRAQLLALGGIPVVQPGDDLAAIIADALEREGVRLQAGDVLVVAQKIVSKAEDRFVALATVTPSVRAVEVAGETGKDPRLVEVILSESKRVVRTRRDLIIVEHRLGIVLANAGVDQSNVGSDASHRVLLLPRDPDASARALRATLAARYGCDVAVVINDSVGRAWRRGTVGIALGAAGLPSLLDLRGQPDMFGRHLRSSIVGLADEIAATASLMMGQADEGRPVVLMRGLSLPREDAPAQSLVRPEQEDLFR
jgi:coenzyme F420-0:L-glutamate ligase / coenzyme F420-1:gamma-L-glutamate ligase